MRWHRPRLPLRWRHRFLRALAPRSWQGRTIQIVLANAILIAALWSNGTFEELRRLWTAWWE